MLRAMTTLAVVVVLASVGAAAPVTATSSIDQVTLYRGQALVTRTVTVPEGAGDLELAIDDLPSGIVGDSISAGAEDAPGVTIRFVRYRTRAVAVDPGKEIAALDDQIKALNARVYVNQQMTALMQAKRVHVDKLENFAVPTAQVEMSKGVLDPNTLEKVSAFIVKQRTELTQEQIKLHEESEALAEQMNLLQRRRAELASRGGKTVREAIVFLSKTAAPAAKIHLAYLVNGADWTPAYNARLAGDGKSVRIEYLAQVHQTSGEDWANAQLTLSTATPAMNAQSPLLVPLWLSLMTPGPQSKSVKGGNYFEQQRERAEQQMTVVRDWNRNLGDNSTAGFRLNTFAAQGQVLELNNDKDVVRSGDLAARAVGEGLAVSYPLPGRMTVVSRADRQLVQIAALKFAPKEYYVAMPLLSSYVYHRANVVNDSALPLLSGEYSAYIDGEFVGRGTMPLVARGQEVTVGFGVDTQLRCMRELKDKGDRTSWGSRRQTFRYTLRLENYKDTAVNVRLVDRIPAYKGDEVGIELEKDGAALSTDAVYLRDLRPKGILRWDVPAPAGAAGAKAVTIDYGFEMTYSKDLKVSAEASVQADQMNADYQAEMMKAAF